MKTSTFFRSEKCSGFSKVPNEIGEWLMVVRMKWHLPIDHYDSKKKINGRKKDWKQIRNSKKWCDTFPIISVELNAEARHTHTHHCNGEFEFFFKWLQLKRSSSRGVVASKRSELKHQAGCERDQKSRTIFTKNNNASINLFSSWVHRASKK